ncbi:hypothetical protein DRP07_11050, partial [Archaeoglobales archaeon]
KENTSDPSINFYNATNLQPGTAYTISTHTVDQSGNVNQTWVNHTATTKSLSPSSPPITGGGGGGGGGPPLFEAQFSSAFVLSKYFPDSNFHEIVVPKSYAEMTDLLSFTLKFKKNIYVDCRFSRVNKLPGTVPNPPAEVNYFAEIVFTKFGTREKVEPEEEYIKFRVEKHWLDVRGYSPDEVLMLRYNGERWVELETSRSGEDDNFYYFTAHVSGFSIFAIGVKAELSTSPLNIHVSNATTPLPAKEPTILETPPNKQKSNYTVISESSESTPSKTTGLLEMTMTIAGIFVILYLFKKRYF